VRRCDVSEKPVPPEPSATIPLVALGRSLLEAGLAAVRDTERQLLAQLPASDRDSLRALLFTLFSAGPPGRGGG
jgi:hypothetical protein